MTDTNPETPAPMTDETLGAIERTAVATKNEIRQMAAELRRHRSSPSTAAGGWIKVAGYRDAPDGEWLVRLEDGSRRVMKKKPNVTIIGGHFAFDMEDVTHYQPLPEPPK